MMVSDVAQVVLVALALLSATVSAVGAVVARTALARLHFLAPLTTLALPLFAAAAVIRTGWSLGSATILLTAIILAFAGPATSAAVGRVLAAEAGADVGRSPE